MGIWFKPGHEDAIMLARLQRLAEGFDANGAPVSYQVQMRATQQWQEIMRKKQLTNNDTTRAQGDMIKAESTRTLAENDRIRADSERTRIMAEVDALNQRLLLEAADVAGKLQIERAKVIVQALAVAVQGGADVAQIMGAIQDLSKALNGGEAPALPGPTSQLLLQGPQK